MSKQILDLPDEMLEMIFSYLDFSSKKNFALSCKRFDGIFSLPWNVDKVLLHHKGGGHIEKVNRPYTNFNYYEFSDRGLTIAPDLKQSFFSNLKSLSFTAVTAEINFIFTVLPFLKNLETLRLRFTPSGQYSVPPKPIAAVEMPNLKNLAIEVDFFMLLNKSYVKFASNNIETLKISRRSSKWHRYIPRRMKPWQISAAHASLKALIVRQERLKVLHLCVDGELRQLLRDDGIPNAQQQTETCKFCIKP